MAATLSHIGLISEKRRTYGFFQLLEGTDPMTISPADTHIDTELVARSRAGEKEAFAELWRQHSEAGLRYARSVTSTFDPDDLVSEAFTRIFTTLKNGNGPRTGFRAYLYATIRNLVTTWAGTRHEIALDDLETYDTGNALSGHEYSLWGPSGVVELLRVLPPRWRQALWLSEVEQLTGSELADIFDITPIAAAALTYRAREGLRRAWNAEMVTADLPEQLIAGKPALALAA
ncbi:RNA polymerase sigma factor [Leifsonia sp. NPDC056665]|uniref:RNA polymerase sigma factor n=1 Tax=Leifsonia sp. NPDC056665 TaxID=3345901 RepID=UPI003688021C